MRLLGTIALFALALPSCGTEQAGAPGAEHRVGAEAPPSSEPGGRVVATVGKGFVTEAEFAEAASHSITPGQTITPEMANRFNLNDDQLESTQQRVSALAYAATTIFA